MSGLSPAAGIHHAVYTGTEWNHERFFRSLKEERIWQHVFRTFEDVRRIIRDWMRWYNEERPHQALGYRSPIQYRAQQLTQVA